MPTQVLLYSFDSSVDQNDETNLGTPITVGLNAHPTETITLSVKIGEKLENLNHDPNPMRNATLTLLFQFLRLYTQY